MNWSIIRVRMPGKTKRVSPEDRQFLGSGIALLNSSETLRPLQALNSTLDGCCGLRSVRIVKGGVGQIIKPRSD